MENKKSRRNDEVIIKDLENHKPIKNSATSQLDSAIVFDGDVITSDNFKSCNRFFTSKSLEDQLTIRFYNLNTLRTKIQILNKLINKFVSSEIHSNEVISKIKNIYNGTNFFYQRNKIWINDIEKSIRETQNDSKAELEKVNSIIHSLNKIVLILDRKDLDLKTSTFDKIIKKLYSLECFLQRSHLKLDDLCFEFREKCTKSDREFSQASKLKFDLEDLVIEYD